MRYLSFALALAAVGLAIPPAQAQAREYPFCLQGRDTAGGRGDCSYPTYQACRATAAGTYAGCYANPYVTYDPEPVLQPRPRRRGY